MNAFRKLYEEDLDLFTMSAFDFVTNAGAGPWTVGRGVDITVKRSPVPLKFYCDIDLKVSNN